MKPEPRSLDPHQLLLDLDWVRALARHLVLDVSTADDLAQETWVRALERPPREEHPTRAWLSAVLRNLIRERVRRTVRRTHREGVVAREEKLPSTDELAAQLELQRRIAKEVLDLDEPYRSTLLLRYVHDLEPADIARERGTPAATVRSHVRRGLERLRERLDAAHGNEREAWSVTAIALCSRPVDMASPMYAATVAGVAAKLAVAVLGTAVLFVAIREWSLSTGAAPPSSPTAAGLGRAEAREETGSLAAPASVAGSRLGVREGRSTRTAVGAERAPAAAPPPVVRGRVVDTEGRAVPGIEVMICALTDPFPASSPLPEVGVDKYSGRTVTTGEGGTFEALLVRGGEVHLWISPPERYMASLHDPRGVTSCTATAPADGLEFIVVENPVATVELRVFDATAGRYLQTFRVSMRRGGTGYSGAYLVTTLEQGGVLRHEFQMADRETESLEIALLSPKQKPALVRTVNLHAGRRTEVTLALQSEHLLRGRVTDTNGAPVPDAAIFFGSYSEMHSDEPFEPFAADRVPGTTSDAEGYYELAGTGTQVTTWHPEFVTRTSDVQNAFSIELERRGRIIGTGLDWPELLFDEETPVAVSNGRFVIENVDAGGHRLAPDEKSLGCGVRVAPGQALTIDFSRRLNRVEVSCDGREEHGALIGDGTVFSMSRFECESGGFALTDVFPGRYRVFGSDGWQGRLHIDGPTVTLERGPATLLLRTEPERRIGLISPDADDLLARIGPRVPAYADASGVLRIEGLYPGEWVLLAENGERRTVALANGVTEVDWR